METKQKNDVAKDVHNNRHRANKRGFQVMLTHDEYDALTELKRLRNDLTNNRIVLTTLIREELDRKIENNRELSS